MMLEYLSTYFVSKKIKNMGQEDVKFSNLSVGEKRIILFSQTWNLVVKGVSHCGLK